MLKIAQHGIFSRFGVNSRIFWPTLMSMSRCDAPFLVGGVFQFILEHRDWHIIDDSRCFSVVQQRPCV